MNDAAITLPSAAMQAIYQQVQQVAPTNSSVLITGETGVGKELIAGEIHRFSRRSHKSFRGINCSSFPDNGLLQSELFGHEKGAFTGQAHNARVCLSRQMEVPSSLMKSVK